MNSILPVSRPMILPRVSIPTIRDPRTGLALRYEREGDTVWVGIPRQTFVEGATVALKVVVVGSAVVLAVSLLESFFAPSKRRVA